MIISYHKMLWLWLLGQQNTYISTFIQMEEFWKWLIKLLYSVMNIRDYYLVWRKVLLVIPYSKYATRQWFPSRVTEDGWSDVRQCRLFRWLTLLACHVGGLACQDHLKYIFRRECQVTWAGLLVELSVSELICLYSFMRGFLLLTWLFSNLLYYWANTY